MIKAITNCPVCDSLLVREKDQLFCRNKNCEAQSLKRIEHFAKALNIKGLGEKTIEKLYLEDITDIYEITKDIIIDELGAALGEKLYLEIEKSRKAPVEKVIYGLSIPSVGEGSAQKLSTINNKNFWDISAADCKVAGLGDVATGKLLSWVADNQNYKTLPHDFSLGFTQVVTSSKGNVCITGKLSDFKTRADAKGFLETHGYIVVDSVTKTTNFLVNEAGEVSSKTEKAAKYGIPIVTIKQLTD